MEKAILILDGSTVIVVDRDKFLLCREVFKHYTPRWQQECADGKATLAEKVKDMLYKLSIAAEVLTGDDALCSMNILTAPQAPAEAKPSAEPKSAK